MFTGLIEDVGTIREIRRGQESMRLTIATSLPTNELALGDSIAVNGVCLTATHLGTGVFGADVSPETLACSTIDRLGPGASVNLERALRVGDRLGGHFVSGHVDGIAMLTARGREGNSIRLTFRLPAELTRYLVVKGSVAVDGISLTVNRVATDSFDLVMIPHTLERTTLRQIRTGDAVNLEVDLLGKYVERLLAGLPTTGRPGGLGLETLAKHGFL
jgi:riboflavin synthase